MNFWKVEILIKSTNSVSLFTIIFKPEMLKFHPYSILTGETMVGVVIYCVLIMFEDISILIVLKKID